MGAGVALSIKQKFPECVKIYFIRTDSRYGLKCRLGETLFGVSENKKIVIANMIAQSGVVGPDNPKPIKYWALVMAMKEVELECLYRIRDGNKVVIHAPEFGSMRAGGNFDFIKELIQEIWKEKWGEVPMEWS